MVPRNTRRPAARRATLEPALLGLAIAGATLVFQAPLWAAAPAPATSRTGGSASAPASDYHALRASHLIGMPVRGARGDEAGRVEDLVYDTRTGELRYALLALDTGVLSAGQRVPVPSARLRLGTDGEALRYEASREELERTAAARAEWTDSLFGNPQQLARIDQAWGTPARAAPRDPALRLASRVLGQPVRDRAGQPVGELQELVVDMAGRRVHYAVVALDAEWAGMDKRVVLPLRALQPAVGQARGGLVLYADKSRLQLMPDFSEERYAGLNERAVRSDVRQWLAAADPGDTRAAGAGTAGAGSPGAGSGSR